MLITDTIGNLSADRFRDLCGKDDGWLPVLQSALSLNVSYNGNSNVAHKDDHGELGLCARILFRCVKSGTIPYSCFDALEFLSSGIKFIEPPCFTSSWGAEFYRQRLVSFG